MKKIVYVLGICALVVGVSSCKSNGGNSTEAQNKSIEATADNSQNALDWEGRYSGIVPCADCPGIETVLTLKSGNTYTLSRKYQSEGQETFVEEGSFKWNAEGNKITLENLKKEETASQYLVGEGKITMLDMEGNKVTGELESNYVLAKVDNELVEKYWKLIEIMGQPIKEGELAKDAFLTFKVEGNRVHGNAGCNTINGTYTVESGHRIKFSRMASTMMMCPNMEVEQKMQKIFETADNYYAKNDTLVLNRARMAPLARFVAVYM